MSKTIVNYGIDRPLDFEEDNEKPAKLQRTSPSGVTTYITSKSYAKAKCCGSECSFMGKKNNEPCWGSTTKYCCSHFCEGHAEYRHGYTDDKDETEMSNWGGTYTREPETKKLNKRGSDQSWWKSKPVSIQQTTDDIPVQID